MRIWQVDLGPNALVADGISHAVRTLAGALVECGHEVTVASSLADVPAGVQVLHCPDGLRGRVAAVRSALVRQRPDVVHLHGGFRPAHVPILWAAHRAGASVVLSPHSAYLVASLGRDRIKKRCYSAVVERRLLRRLDGLAVLTEQEHTESMRFLGSSAAPVAVVPNPVRLPDGTCHEPRADASSLVCLARFDVLQKGLDRLCEVARHLDGVQVTVHGQRDQNDPAAMDAVIARAPSNLRFAEPVVGPDKWAAVAGADAVVMLSRWEGFSVALAEALAVGTPVVVSEEVGLTAPVAALGMGEVVNGDDAVATASVVRAMLADEQVRRSMSEAGRDYGRQLTPRAIAIQMAAFYDRIC